MISRLIPKRSLIYRLIMPLVGAGILILSTPLAMADNAIATLWEIQYPTSFSLVNGGCALCHDQSDPLRNDMPIVNNGYGVALQNHPSIGINPVTVFQDVEGLNSDNDVGGYTNIDEINGNVQPGWTTGDPVPSTVSGNLDPYDPLMADANGPYVGSVGETISFDGSGSSDDDGIIVSYEWDFGDGSTGTGVSPTYTYSTADTYTVTLTVTDNDGLTDTATTTADINNPPVADPNGPYTYLIGEVITFDGTGSSDSDGVIVSHEWDFGDGNTGIGPTPSHIYAVADTYLVTLTVTDNDGASDTNTTTAIHGGSHLIADAGGPYELDFDKQPVRFDGSNSCCTIVSYDWNFGDGTTGSGVQVDHTYALPGEYTVTLTVTDDLGVTDSDTATVNIINTNVVPIADADGPYIGCIDVLVQFDGSNSNDDGMIVSYDWNYGDGTEAQDAGPTPTHIYTAVGTYTVTLTVIDDGEPVYSASDTTTATIDNCRPMADPGGPYYGIVNVPVSFDGSGSIDLDGTVEEWHWNFGDGNTGTGEFSTHTYTDLGTYTVTLTVVDNDGRVSNPASTEAKIGGGPPIADPNGPYTGIEGSEVTFDGTGSYDPNGGEIVSYAWNFGDGNTDIGPTPTNMYAIADEYTVTLVVTDDQGEVSGEASTTATIDFNPLPIADAGGPYTADILFDQPVQFDGTGSEDDGEVVTWEWDFGDGSFGTGPTPTHEYPSVGVYVVRLTVTDDLGKTGTDETTADIFVGERVPVADANGSYEANIDEVITFDGSGSTDDNGDDTIVSYEWGFGDGNTSTGEFVEHAYANPGTYYVTLTVTDDTGRSDTDNTTARILDPDGDADVYLTQMRVPTLLTLRQGRELTRRILVYSDGDKIEQEATVTLTAGLPGILVDIIPESLTKLVVPGGANTLFTFTAVIECVEPGSYVLDWTAVINAPVNSDPDNDVLIESTVTECKGRSGGTGSMLRNNNR